MNSRTLLVLAGLLVAAGIFLWWSDKPEPVSDEPGVGELLVPELEADLDRVERIVVRADGGETVADVQRGEHGWVLANRSDHPANASTIRRVLVALTEAERREPRTADPAQYHRLGLAEMADGNPDGLEYRLYGFESPITVVIGRTAAGDVGSYARRADEAQTWIVSEIVPRRARVGDWLDGALLDIPVWEIEEVRIDPPSGTPIRITNPVRGGRDFEVHDVPAGHQLLTPTIGRSLARVVTELEMTDAVAEDEAPTLEPAGGARYRTFDGLVVEIGAWLGEDAAEAPFVRLRASAESDDAGSRAEALNRRWDGWIYRVPDYKIENATQSLDRIIELTPH